MPPKQNPNKSKDPRALERTTGGSPPSQQLDTYRSTDMSRQTHMIDLNTNKSDQSVGPKDYEPTSQKIVQISANKPTSNSDFNDEDHKSSKSPQTYQKE